MNALPLFNGALPMSRPLRHHQQQAIALLRASLARGNRRVVLQMPTGAGKTRTAAEIVNGALSKGNRVCFTVPAISLIDQTVDAFEAEGIFDLGVIQACHPRTQPNMPVQIASVQSLARRGLPDVGVVVVDECHMQHEVITKWMVDEPGKTFIGLSATPWARGMADHWQDLVIPVRMQELIDAGFLSPFRVFAPSHPDLSGVSTVAGDYHEGQLADVMSDRVLVADIVQTWQDRACNRPTLVFAVNRAHAAKLQGEFARAGVAMGYCDAHVDRIERAFLFDQMASGELAGIVNVGTLTTGVDADVRCIVLARPTKSEMLFVQMIGRGLRTAPGKADCLILDHADNHARMGFVTDIHHHSLLAGQEKRALTRKEKGEPMPKECPACHTLKAPKISECPACGFTPTRQSDIEAEEGELVELTRKPKKEKFTQDQKSQWMGGLLWVARDKGYSTGWASHKYREKFGVWPQGVDRLAMPPTDELRNWLKSKAIARAKAQAAGRGARP